MYSKCDFNLVSTCFPLRVDAICEVWAKNENGRLILLLVKVCAPYKHITKFFITMNITSNAVSSKVTGDGPHKL